LHQPEGVLHWDRSADVSGSSTVHTSVPRSISPLPLRKSIHNVGKLEPAGPDVAFELGMVFSPENQHCGRCQADQADDERDGCEYLGHW
jgi:hypothetical protein